MCSRKKSVTYCYQIRHKYYVRFSLIADAHLTTPTTCIPKLSPLIVTTQRAAPVVAAFRCNGRIRHLLEKLKAREKTEKERGSKN